MGFELNKLMRQYGLATPTMAQYTGEMGRDVDIIDEDENSDTFGNVIGVTPGTLTFDPAKQAAFDNYQDQYQFRLSNRPMYESAQFRTTPAQQQPQTYEDMFTMYLGRPRGDGETLSGPVNDAQRNEFLRIYENEFADLGINNTGNQLVSDQIGNYYGNILRNPDFVSDVPTTPVDPSAPFIERNPTVVNPNPPFSGTMISTDQAYYNPEDPPVVDGEVSQTFLDFANQQDIINANLNNPLPDESITTLDLAQNVDPFAPMDNGLPAYSAYLAKNLDVFDDITGFRSGTPQPGYAALNIPVGGFAPGTPEALAVNQYVAQAAKDHFVNHGFQEGRKFYNRGGEVKGYRHGGGTMPHAEDAGTAGIEDAGIRVDITTPKAEIPTLDDISETIVTGESPTNESLILEMLEKGEMAPTAYDNKLAQQQQQLGENTAAFQKMMLDIAEGQSAGPSESEQWFRLAAALNESKDGSFMGSVASAAEEFAEIGKEKRQAGVKGDALKLQAAKYGLDTLEKAITQTSGLAKEKRDEIRNTRNYYRELIDEHKKFQRDKKYDLMVLREQRAFDADKPLTTAAKTAKDMGLQRGTPEYNEFVQKYYAEEQAIRKLEMQAMKANAGRLTNPEITQLVDADTKLDAVNESLSNLNEALKINPKAYGDSWTDVAAKFAKGVYAPNDEKYRMSERLENLLTKGALRVLKLTFGGNITEGERAILIKVQGLGTKSVKERGEIITEAARALVNVRRKLEERRRLIKSGDYVRKET
tara:strand:- start:3950 stop:6226 length:2277 start_codon:yes stop_codon:yes gene_type:complete